MQLLLKKLSMPVGLSFSVRKDEFPCLDEYLHFHPEFELILILKGHGMRLVGDNISAFKEGDMAFIGPNLPHLWRNDKLFYQDNKQEVEVVVIHFLEDFLGKDFFLKNEMKGIFQLFNNSRQGLHIHGETNTSIAAKIKQLLNAEGFSKILILLEILYELSSSQDIHVLTRSGYHHNFSKSDTIRMDKVYKYLIDHFKDDIKLDEIAAIANLSSSAFCRYFKKRTKKSFSIFLNDMKIGYACKLLIEGEYSISQIGYECGYNSLTNFNRQFKRTTGMAPYKYRKQYINMP
jgi:AraC-like DNA-binding protein